jgi:hypothetical protein
MSRRPKAFAEEFDRDGKCPICRRHFRGGDCPHSIEEARRKLHDDERDARTRQIIRQEMARSVGAAKKGGG